MSNMWATTLNVSRTRPYAPVPASEAKHWIHQARAVVVLSIARFRSIDGPERAAAFAYYAFFALFPVLVLLVTIASAGVDHDRAVGDVVRYVEGYLPIGTELQSRISHTVAGVIKQGKVAGGVAVVMLIWVAIQGVTTLINTTNRAWGTEAHNWWRLPLRSLVVLGIVICTVLLGMTLPVLARAAQHWLFPPDDLLPWMFDISVGFVMPLAVVFIGLCWFYKLAPGRTTRFAEVWLAALVTTALLRASEILFVVYLRDFATYNAVYGTFGGIMALMVWLYLSGCIIILGACLCAAQAEMRQPVLEPV